MISPLAVVESDDIGNNVTIHEYAIIRKNVVIEDNVVIHPFVVLEKGVTIGNGTEIFPGSIIGKPPKGAGATARPIAFDKHVLIGKNCSIGPHAVVYYDVHIGDNTLLGDGASIREGCRIGSLCIISRYVTVNYDTSIGKEVKIMDYTHLTGNMSIGDNTFISVGVLSANDNNMGAKGYEKGKIIGPQIQKESRIGLGAILLPNLEIGENSVIAAGAVATKDVDPHTVVMGVPAKVVNRIQKNASSDDDTQDLD